MAHEDLSREEQIESSSDRSFGFVFATVFAVIAAWPLFHAQNFRWWAFSIALGLALIALVKPALLALPNRLWAKFGIVLGKVVSPIALGILFFCIVAPIGILMRIAGQDPLRLKRDPKADSYWIQRDPPGPPPDSMKNQF